MGGGGVRAGGWETSLPHALCFKPHFCKLTDLPSNHMTHYKQSPWFNTFSSNSTLCLPKKFFGFQKKNLNKKY